jgi:hypothetical protein
VVGGLSLLAEPVDQLDGGLPVVAWVKLWSMCHAVMADGIIRTDWPDGGTAIDQPMVTVQMFDVISSVVSEACKSDGK